MMHSSGSFCTVIRSSLTAGLNLIKGVDCGRTCFFICCNALQLYPFWLKVNLVRSCILAATCDHLLRCRFNLAPAMAETFAFNADIQQRIGLLINTFHVNQEIFLNLYLELLLQNEINLVRSMEPPHFWLFELGQCLLCASSKIHRQIISDRSRDISRGAH